MYGEVLDLGENVYLGFNSPLNCLAGPGLQACRQGGGRVRWENPCPVPGRRGEQMGDDGASPLLPLIISALGILTQG